MKTDTPLISVIVPVYNSEKFLDKCIMSLREQTLKNIEIILVDDVSPDNSKEIMERHASQDSRIVTVYNKINGKPKPRNAGIEIASGYYLGFVDADDWVEPTMYEDLYKASNDGLIDVVIGNKKNCYSNGVTENEEQFVNVDITNPLEVKKHVALFGGGIMTNIWKKSLIYPRLLFTDGLFYSDTISIAWYLSANSFARIKEFGYNYFINVDSITRKKDNPIFWHRTDSALDMRKRCLHLGLYEKHPEEVDYAFYRLYFRNTLMLLNRSFSHVPTNKIKEIRKVLRKEVNIDNNKYFVAHKNENDNLAAVILMWNEIIGIMYLRINMMLYKLRVKLALGQRLRNLKRKI